MAIDLIDAGSIFSKTRRCDRVVLAYRRVFVFEFKAVEHAP